MDLGRTHDPFDRLIVAPAWGKDPRMMVLRANMFANHCGDGVWKRLGEIVTATG